MPSIYFSAEASHISPMLATVSRNLIMRQHVSSINPKMWCSSSPSLKLPKWSICLTFSSRMTSKIVRAQHQRETTSYSFLLSFTFPAERASSHLIQRLGVMTWKSALIHMYYLLSLQKRIGPSYMWLDWQVWGIEKGTFHTRISVQLEHNGWKSTKSPIQHCERSELRLHFEWPKVS